MADDPAPLDLDPKMSTADLQALMAAKYRAEDGYALFFDVPDNVGLDSRRRADAVAVGMWKSSGRLIEGFELKVSRADWLREVKAVAKADPFIERCDRWWLVTASPAIAKLEEIPACWGWMSATKSGLRVQKMAPRLPQADRAELSRLFVYGILRKVAEYRHANSPEVQAMLTNIREQQAGEVERRVQERIKHEHGELPRLRAKVEAFEKELGLSLSDWRAGHVAKIALELSKLTYGADGLDEVAVELERQRRVLDNMRECFDLAIAQCRGRAG